MWQQLAVNFRHLDFVFATFALAILNIAKIM